MNIINPLVSVIIPTYNRKRLVCRAAKTVLAQTHDHLECIVVDDCSTDGTLDALTELSYQDQRLRVISHLENRHASAARNTGISASQGELIAFLDDDDTWLPEKLEKQMKCLSQAPSKVGMVYCWFDIYRDQEIIGTRRPQLRGNIFDQLLISQPLGNASTLLVRREVIDHIGGFDENLPRGNDGDFIRRVGQHYEIEVVPEVLVHYFVDHNGQSRITDSFGTITTIQSREARLEKFSKELSTRPKIHSSLLYDLAIRYALVNQISKSIITFGKALKLSPFNIKLFLHNCFKLCYYLITYKK